MKNKKVNFTKENEQQNIIEGTATFKVLDDVLNSEIDTEIKEKKKEEVKKELSQSDKIALIKKRLVELNALKK